METNNTNTEKKANTSLLFIMKEIFNNAFLAFISLFDFFSREESMISKEGQMILSNKKDRDSLMNALNDDKSTTVTTSVGEIHIG